MKEQSLVSHHLKELYQCGLVEKERRGKKNFYKVSKEEILECEIKELSQEVRKYTIEQMSKDSIDHTARLPLEICSLT